MKQTDAAPRRILVVGGGIVGISIALRLRMDGLDVWLIERDEPMQGCSSGNAGYLTESNILPPLNRGILKQIPRLLVDKNGPLVMDPRYLRQILPWSLRAVGASRANTSAEIQNALGAFSRRALADFRPLIEEAGAGGLISHEGSLVVFKTPGGLSKRAMLIPAWQSQGIDVRQVGPETVREMEPALSKDLIGAIHFPNSARCLDPKALGLRYLARFAALGGVVIKDEVRNVKDTGDGQVAVEATRQRFVGSHAIVCAGFWSAQLMKPYFKSAIPLASERGYHYMLPTPGARLSRPVVFGEPYFAATPMAQGLRLAGTAEFAQPDAPARMDRATQLFRQATAYIPELQERGAQPWMGVRPSFPDGKPAIGRVAQVPGILYAFGHGHCGLTYSATTAQCVSDLIRGAEPATSLAPFQLERFAA